MDFINKGGGKKKKAVTNGSPKLQRDTGGPASPLVTELSRTSWEKGRSFTRAPVRVKEGPEKSSKFLRKGEFFLEGATLGTKSDDEGVRRRE